MAEEQSEIERMRARCEEVHSGASDDDARAIQHFVGRKRVVGLQGENATDPAKDSQTAQKNDRASKND